MSQQARYLGRRSFRWKVVVHARTHTHTTGRLLYTATKVVGGIEIEIE